MTSRAINRRKASGYGAQPSSGGAGGSSGLNGVAATSSTNAWAVGSYDNGARTATRYRPLLYARDCGRDRCGFYPPGPLHNRGPDVSRGPNPERMHGSIILVQRLVPPQCKPVDAIVRHLQGDKDRLRAGPFIASDPGGHAMHGEHRAQVTDVPMPLACSLVKGEERRWVLIHAS